MKRGKGRKKSWDEMVKEDMKRGLCINDAKIETSWDDIAEEWSIPVNWEEDPAIKVERRRIDWYFL